MYVPQKNKAFDEVLRRGRARFRPVQLFSRKEGIKPILRAMRERMPYFMLPDMDFGDKDADVRALLRRAGGDPDGARAASPAATGAKVIPVVATFLPDYQGWRVTLLSGLGKLSGRRHGRGHAPHERLHRGAGARGAGRILLDPQALQDPARRASPRSYVSLERAILAAMKLKFTKMHGAGNDFIVIDAISQQVDSHARTMGRLADRRFGIGADQILVVRKARQPPAATSATASSTATAAKSNNAATARAPSSSSSPTRA